MKKFHQWLIGISLIGMLVSGVASASFSGGGGGGLSITEIITGITGIFAKLDETNTFVKDQKINDADSLAGGTYSGMRLQTTERASYCLGPSDGQNNEFCISGGSLFQIHGAGGPLYDGAVTGNQIIEAQPQLSRVWLGRTSSVVIAGGGGVPDLNVGIGGSTKATATLEIDTTNDWTKHLSISAPAASECDDATEKGRLYFDDTANEFKFCNGTAWSSFGGGGGGGAGGNVTNTIDRYTIANCNNDANDFYDDGTIRLSWNQPDEKLEVEVLTSPSGSKVGATCETRGGYTSSYYAETMIETSTATNISPSNGAIPGDVMVCTIGAAQDATYPSYEITFHNVGNGGGGNLNCNVKIEKQDP